MNLAAVGGPRVHIQFVMDASVAVLRPNRLRAERKNDLVRQSFFYKAMICGVKCDHLAFSGPQVDWQVWIAEGDTPLPYKYVLTTRDVASYPELTVVMRNWNVSPNLSEAAFSFMPPAGVKQIDFLSAGSGGASAR